jgi:hypothetical protein
MHHPAPGRDVEHVVEVRVRVGADVPIIGPSPIVQLFEVDELALDGSQGLAEQKEARNRRAFRHGGDLHAKVGRLACSVEKSNFCDALSILIADRQGQV